MSKKPLSEREKNLSECVEILQTIEETFSQISQALEKTYNKTVIANIERERESIQEQVRNLDGTIEEVNLYTKMRLEALSPMIRGLLNYARNKETTKVRNRDRMVTIMLKPSTIMEAKGSLRKFAKLHPGNMIKIEMRGAKVPKKIFTDNDFYIIDDRSQNEVLVGKEMNQPRVLSQREEDGILTSPAIQIYNEEEFKTVLDRHFFDDYVALVIQKRMTIIVP